MGTLVLGNGLRAPMVPANGADEAYLALLRRILDEGWTSPTAPARDAQRVRSPNTL